MSNHRTRRVPQLTVTPLEGRMLLSHTVPLGGGHVVELAKSRAFLLDGTVRGSAVVDPSALTIQISGAGKLRSTGRVGASGTFQALLAGDPANPSIQIASGSVVLANSKGTLTLVEQGMPTVTSAGKKGSKFVSQFTIAQGTQAYAAITGTGSLTVTYTSAGKFTASLHSNR